MSNYKAPQLNFEDDLTARRMVDIIERVVEKKLNELTFASYQVATVTAVSGNNADVILPGGTSSIPNLKNKTGEVLNNGDEVYLLLIKNSLNNSVIAIKK